MSLLTFRFAFRSAFVVYAIALLVATHWPRLRIEGGVPRSDLYVHVAAYALWTWLLLLTGWAGPVNRGLTLARAGLIAAGVAALDEATQAIPALGRHAALDDWLADLLGIALAVGVCRMLGSNRSNRESPAQNC